MLWHIAENDSTLLCRGGFALLWVLSLLLLLLLTIAALPVFKHTGVALGSCCCCSEHFVVGDFILRGGGAVQSW